MATLVTPTNLQKIEFDVTTAEGPSRVTIVTGTLDVLMNVTSSDLMGVVQNYSFKALLDPTLTPGQFRKATATASITNLRVVTGALPTEASWAIDDVQATFDDEAGRVQLVIDAWVRVTGTQSNSQVHRFHFQVTTLARV